VTERAQVFVDLWPEQAVRIFVEQAGFRQHTMDWSCRPGARLVFTWRELDWPEGVSTDSVRRRGKPPPSPSWPELAQ
jgi:hypothetical protein